MNSAEVCPVCFGPLARGATACDACTTAAQSIATADGNPPRIPGFRIVRELGRGGMGVVYEAEDLSLGRRVAIKTMKPSSNIAHHDRFVREAKLMATIEDPSVIRVYAFGEADDRRFLIMECVEGESLAERIARVRRLPVDQTLRIALQIAFGLRTAAEKGVIHRDIKPSNILIDRRDNVRVSDFGLARSIQAPAGPDSLAGDFVGTPHYVAPEQAEGREAGVQADMYALGVVLFEMLIGRPPFSGSTALAVVAKQLHDPFPRIRRFRPEIPAAVQNLIDRLTAKDPSLRPGSWDDVIADIESIARSYVAPVSAWEFMRLPLTPGAMILSLPLAILVAFLAWVLLGAAVFGLEAVLRRVMPKAGLFWFLFSIIAGAPVLGLAWLLHRQRMRASALRR